MTGIIIVVILLIVSFIIAAGRSQFLFPVAEPLHMAKPLDGEVRGQYSHSIKIEGDKDFILTTEKALNYIAEKSPEHYEMVKKYMKKIVQTDGDSEMLVHEDPPTFLVNNTEADSPLCWYASDIVHDAYHSKLYHDYRAEHFYVPDRIYIGYEGEMKCLQVQKEFLVAAGADQRYLNWIDIVPETRWWVK